MPNIADIFAEARKLVDADSLSYQDADLLRRVNASYERRLGQLIQNNNKWKFGDSNYTSLPTGLLTMEEGVSTVAFNSAMLTLLNLQVKDAEGIWHKLTLLDPTSIGTPLQEYQKEAGRPSEYLVRDGFIVLFPAPTATAVTLADGLQGDYQRTADIFTLAQVTTGTKTPGFASPYHYILSYDAALPYAISYKPQRVQAITNEIARLEKEMLNFDSQKDKSERAIMTFKQRCFK